MFAFCCISNLSIVNKPNICLKKHAYLKVSLHLLILEGQLSEPYRRKWKNCKVSRSSIREESCLLGQKTSKYSNQLFTKTSISIAANWKFLKKLFSVFILQTIKHDEDRGEKLTCYQILLRLFFLSNSFINKPLINQTHKDCKQIIYFSITADKRYQQYRFVAIRFYRLKIPIMPRKNES